MAATLPYPPPRHLLRDLDLSVDRRGGAPEVRLPVLPGLLDAAGSVRAGALGLALDVLGGAISIQAAQPDWALTSDLSLWLLRPCAGGSVCVRGQALRAGRTQLVVEAEIRAETGEEAAPLAHGQLGFTRVPRRDDTPPVPEEPGDVHSFGAGAPRLAVPLLEALRLSALDPAEGRVELPLGDYVTNSVGGLQGGVVTMLLDAAAVAAGDALLGGPTAVADLSVRYLALSRVGPARTRARCLRSDAREALLRVEVLDAGQQDRLASVGTARVRRV